MSHEAENTLYGPMPSGEWLRDQRERIAAAEVNREADEASDFLANIQAMAQKAMAMWEAVPCHGEMDQVTHCSGAFQATCDLREHVACPRQAISRIAAEERAKKAEKRLQLLRLGIPDNALRAIYDSEPVDTEALRRLRETLALSPLPRVIVLSGGVGCGKTCAASWWAIRRTARFVTARTFAAMSPYGEEADTLIRSPRLVLDDLGTEYVDPKGFFLASLDGLINQRYADGLPLVITTNLPLDAPSHSPQTPCFRRYGDRVIDRIRECGRFVAIGGGSMRRKA